MKNLKTFAISAIATISAAALTPAAHAQATLDSMTIAQATSTTSAAPETTDGEVRKIDLEAGKLTLKHGDIKSLDMPGMTMVFVVKDKAMLDKLKAGDKVKFKAINEGGKFTVTDIQPLR